VWRSAILSHILWFDAAEAMGRINWLLLCVCDCCALLIRKCSVQPSVCGVKSLQSISANPPAIGPKSHCLREYGGTEVMKICPAIDSIHSTGRLNWLLLCDLPLLAAAGGAAAGMDILVLGDWGGQTAAPYWVDAQVENTAGMDACVLTVPSFAGPPCRGVLSAIPLA
jgi:hypothetical protein